MPVRDSGSFPNDLAQFLIDSFAGLEDPGIRRALRQPATAAQADQHVAEALAEASEHSGGQSVLLTFGHGAASAEQMISLLRGAGISMLVDVRTAPGSRRHPHVARAELQRWLPAAGITYRWDKRLGGLRTAEPDSPDVAFNVNTLRGYAGHMRTSAFVTAVDQVLTLASARGTAVMCAESLWWRCHRRMLADFVTAARGVPVRHLMHDGRLEEHRLSPGLRLRDDGLLVYDGGQPPLL